MQNRRVFRATHPSLVHHAWDSVRRQQPATAIRIRLLYRLVRKTGQFELLVKEQRKGDREQGSVQHLVAAQVVKRVTSPRRPRQLGL